MGWRGMHSSAPEREKNGVQLWRR